MRIEEKDVVDSLSYIGVVGPGVWAQLHQAGRKVPWLPEGAHAGTAVLLFVLVIALLVATVYMARRLLALLKQPGPKGALFAELARAHELSRAEQKVLKQLARREKLSNPGLVFVEKRHLEAYAKSHVEAIYRELYEKLFTL